MGKGRNRGRGGAAATTASGGVAGQRNLLAAKIDASLIDQVLPGRHPCRCQARRHALVNNCLGCGKIVCVQEGSGPCFFCGQLVCTNEEREILDRGSRKSAELYEKLMGSPLGKDGPSGLSLAAVSRDLEQATAFRNRLLAADADAERRNKVNDLDSDYISSETNPYLTATEREMIQQRRAELKRMQEQRRKQLILSLNLTNMEVSEETIDPTFADPARDPLIRDILEASTERRRHEEAAMSTVVDARWFPKGFVPKYDDQYATRHQSNIHEYVDAMDQLMLNEELARMEVEKRGYTIVVPQPLATLLVYGLVKAIRWPEDLHLKGAIFVGSAIKHTSETEHIDHIKKYCKESGYAQAATLDYPIGCIHGRVVVEDILTPEEYRQAYDNRPIAGEGDFVLVFSASEPIKSPVPHIGPSNYYQLSPELRSSLCNILR